MLDNPYQTSASARPKYALGALNGTAEGGNPLKKAVILVLMAFAGGLFLVLPDGKEEVFAIEADSGAAAPQATIIDDEVTTSTLVREVSSGAGSAADAAADAQVAVATEAALAGMEHNVRSGLALSSAGDLMEGARAAAASLQSPPTTAPPAPAVPAPTEQPTTSADPETTGDSGSTTSEAPTTTTPETASSDSTAEGETTETSGDTSTTSSETTDTTAAPDATVAPETTETTVAETTTTQAANGWVDAGHGVLVPPILIEIRFCESRHNYTAANPSSSARGAYQFLTGSWDAYGHKDRYGVNQAHLATPAQQDEAALITWERDGTRPWNASRSCWG